jgi:7,8-dihydroneopterin aldolase/epimerase/oxygenase
MNNNMDLMTDCRKLFLRNFRVDANIGVHEFEKRGTQALHINVDLYVPLANTTPKVDDLSEVVDYDFIRTTIVERIAKGHIHLQETLCDDIAAMMMKHPLVKAVRVSTEKPDVYLNCEAVGVEVFKVKA